MKYSHSHAAPERFVLCVHQKPIFPLELNGWNGILCECLEWCFVALRFYDQVNPNGVMSSAKSLRIAATL